jgi:hypothetical protein
MQADLGPRKCRILEWGWEEKVKKWLQVYREGRRTVRLAWGGGMGIEGEIKDLNAIRMTVFDGAFFNH